MKYVFDSTPLIYFGKLNILDKIVKLKGDKIIPSSVFKEVFEDGLRRGKEDAYLLNDFVKRGFFFMEKDSSKIMEEFREIRKLSLADAETLALAKNKRAFAIVDEILSRKIAEANGIEHGGSIFILFKLYKENIIAKKDIKIFLDAMIRLKWRCSAELYASTINEIEEL